MPPKTEPAEPVIYAMPAELAQATVNYLLRHPANEVLDLIDGFRALEPLKSETPTDET